MNVVKCECKSPTRDKGRELATVINPSCSTLVSCAVVELR